MKTNRIPELQQIVEAIHARQRFVLSSHSRPDGDSIGSQLAMAYALPQILYRRSSAHWSSKRGAVMARAGLGAILPLLMPE